MEKKQERNVGEPGRFKDPLQVRLSWKLKKIEMDFNLYLHTVNMSATKTFTRWTEEERRAHRRKQNAAYQARKVEHLTPREKQIKEEERRKRQETKQAMEQGEWVAATVTVTVKTVKTVKEEKKVKAKNGFAALESDEEEVKVKEWGKKIDWAADSDDE